MIMTVEPSYTGRTGSTWKAYCSLCQRILKNSYQTRWHARRAAASHLWAHRSDHPPQPKGTPEERNAKLTRAAQLAELMAGHGPCPTPTKRKHISKKEAEDEHIARLNAAGRGNPDYNAYRCSCGAWHVGHSKEKFEQRLKKVTRRSADTNQKRRTRR